MDADRHSFVAITGLINISPEESIPNREVEAKVTVGLVALD